jgi:hypothetical protein
VLDSSRGKLTYMDGNTVKGEINLAGVHVIKLDPREADGHENAFKIMNIQDDLATRVNELVLSAGSEPEVDDWMRAIKLASRPISTTISPVGHTYESFDNMESTPQATTDPSYYRNLRTKRQTINQSSRSTQPMSNSSSTEQFPTETKPVNSSAVHEGSERGSTDRDMSIVDLN